MISRLVIPATTALVVLAATIMLWKTLESREIAQMARIAELESYSARSRLVKDVDQMLSALRGVQSYWAKYANLPRDQWQDDAEIELSHFAGLEFIIWSQSSRSVRYIRNAQYPVFDYRPSDDEWGTYTPLMEQAEALSEDTMVGPILKEDGDIIFELFFVPENPQENGILIAKIDASEFLSSMMENSAPGYAITVSWKGEAIFEKNQPHKDSPEQLVREGEIEPFVGTFWNVSHTPTTSWFKSMESPAVDATLVSGILISALLGLLMFFTASAKIGQRNAVQAKAELSIVNLNLEAIIAKRTKELHMRSADLVTITDSVGHDLRNPLNAIFANNQLLEQQFRSQLGVDGLEIIKQSSNCVGNMTQILDRLLSLSTVSSSNFSRKLVHMRALGEQVMEELLYADPEPPVNFVLGDIPDANADQLMVRTLLTNLLSNALKYSRAKSVRNIEFQSEFKSGVITYYVKDNGQGFESVYAKHIFEAYERFDHSDTTQGLGLGLDIAKRVVQRHDGVIWATGSPGEGAAFYFTLGDESIVS